MGYKKYRFELRLLRERRRVGVEGGRPRRVPRQRVGQRREAAVGAEPLAATLVAVGLALAEDPGVPKLIVYISKEV